MYYVVVDFEWNQSPYGKGSGNKRLPFEIIEIGAVKLDESFNILGRYDAVIRPKVYKRLHHMTKELTGFSEEQLQSGMAFKDAAIDFLLWCGSDYTFCTWGNTDLIEFQRNLDFYKILDLLPGPIKYFNLQKVYRLFYSSDAAACSLEAAARQYGIDSSESFHRAIHDAQYTAEIFKAMDIDAVRRNFTVDYYQYPQSKKEEIALTYDHYYKYISRGFETKELALEDKEVRSTRCYLCGKTAVKKVRWFVSKNRAHYCLAYCKEHGLIRGKIKLKKMDDGMIVAVKTIRMADDEMAEYIRQMKKEVVTKRRERRHHGKGNEDL